MRHGTGGITGSGWRGVRYKYVEQGRVRYEMLRSCNATRGTDNLGDIGAVRILRMRRPV